MSKLKTVCEISFINLPLFFSHPLVHQPTSVRDGNSSSISVLAHVNQNLEVEEGAFRFLVKQVNGKPKDGNL